MSSPSYPASPTSAIESQSERRLKYGSIVALTILIAIALAVVFVYLSERHPKRVDTTASGLFSLKPQTVNLIKDNPQKIKIISLYTKAKPPQVQQTSEQTPAMTEAVAVEQAEKMSDLLEEYHDKGKNVEVESIDPVANPVKVDQLVNEVTAQYGGQVEKYKAFVGGEDPKQVGSYVAAFEQMVQTLQKPIDAMKAMNTSEVKDEQLASDLNDVYLTLNTAQKSLKSEQERIRPALKEKPPLYKKAADDIKEHVDDISQQAAALQQISAKYKVDKTAPASIQKLFGGMEPSFAELKKQADAISKEEAGLGELKLDTLSDALRQRNSVLIRGEHDWKVIPYDQIWLQSRAQRRPDASGPPPVRFAGEQMITAAIYTLQHPQKLKVAFVRPGGQALTQAGFEPFIHGGPYADIAESLREYNYDVVEKDLTGMSQMQQQQGAPPEPSDAEIKDALWIVVDTQAQSGQFGAPPTIAPKVADHLNQGGSALFLVGLQGDDMAMALKDWGITLQPNQCIVHETSHSEGARGSDIDQALNLPFLFPIREWGDSPVTGPLASMPGVLIYGVPVKTAPAKDVQSWPIIPVPQTVKTWATSDLESLQSNPNPTFNAEKDAPGPFYAGAVAEKKGQGRVVVIGSPQMPYSGVVSFSENGRAVNFPGNRELFMDSIFWLSHQETMIAISPAAMDVSRIAPMSTAVQNVWRGGVLLILLPALVIVLGALVFIARRD
jgi:hypothetical protein